MRKNILKLSILSLILISISSIILILFGRVYTASFKLNSASTYNIELENETGRVEILDEKKVGDNYIVKVESQKPGRLHWF